ncbi:24009_t:CDS:2, partial [Cetraspora pellucida]
IELDSKVSELEHLKSEDISISVVGGNSEKNISKSRPEGPLLCNNNISAVSETSKNLKSSKIDTKVTSKVSDETIINENNKDNILQQINAENQFQEIKNMIPIRSHNITIGKSEELPIIALGANSLNSKPDYIHSMTTSGNLFSEIYSQSEGTNVSKLTMNEQSEYIENRVMDSQSSMQKNSKIPPMKLFLMDMDEANKHAASRCQSHPASPTWPFRMIVTGK